MRKPSTWRLVWHFGGNGVYQGLGKVRAQKSDSFALSQLGSESAFCKRVKLTTNYFSREK